MKLSLFDYKCLILFLTVFLIFSCKKDNSPKNGVWEEFKTEIENENLTYLLNNSSDSIECVDCIQGDSNEFYSSELIFKKHLNNLYNSERLIDKEYAFYETDSIIRISYILKSPSEELTSTVYMFDKGGEKYLFTGMITVP